MAAFLGDTIIIPELRRAASALDLINERLREGAYRLDEAIRSEIGDLDVLAAFAHELAGDVYYREQTDLTGLPHLWAAIRVGFESEDLTTTASSVRYVREISDEEFGSRYGGPRARGGPLQAPDHVWDVPEEVFRTVRDVNDFVDRRWLISLDERLARLRAAAAMRYPKMPVPEWLLKR